MEGKELWIKGIVSVLEGVDDKVGVPMEEGVKGVVRFDGQVYCEDGSMVFCLVRGVKREGEVFSGGFSVKVV